MLRRITVSVFVLVLFITSVLGHSETTYRTEEKIFYRTEKSPSSDMQDRCLLDLYVPQGIKDFPTVVWFHGGGLKNGERFIPQELKNQGLAVVGAGYRLSPKSKCPAYIEDAASAVAWTFANIEKYGGSKKKIFVSGHSAGGYLTSMLGLDKRWLKAQGIDADQIAGLIPFSGQCITHFTIREERGIRDTKPIIDEMAPLFHVRKDAPPILIITGDRNQELLGRYEESAYFWRMLKLVGHPSVEIDELQGFDHGTMQKPGHELLLNFIRKIFPNPKTLEKKK
jgi:acetyl esterase/lipase